MPSYIDFSQGRPDPNAFQNAYDFGNKMYQYAARRQAGQQYAGGDYEGAAKTIAGTGDFETAGKIADRQIAQIQKQQDALGRVGGALDAAYAQDPNLAAPLWQMGLRNLQAVGVKPETLGQLQQMYAANPKQAIAFMKAQAARDLAIETSEGITRVIDKRTGQQVAQYGAGGLFRGNDLTAQAWNIARDPKADPRDRRIAEQILSTPRTSVTAAGIVEIPGQDASWLGTGGAPPPAETLAASPPAPGPAPAPMLAPQGTPHAAPQSVPAPSEDDRTIWENMNPGGGAISIDANGNYWRNTANGPVPVTNDDGSQVQARTGGTSTPAPAATPAPSGAQASPAPIRTPSGVTVTPLPRQETWNAPVSEIRDGKPARVQYSNLGNSRVVAGAAPMLTPSQQAATAPPLSDAAVNTQVETFVAGGPLPSFGYGPAGAAARNRFWEALAARNMAAGKTGVDVAADRAELAVNRNALGVVTRQQALVNQFEGTARRNADLVLQTAEKGIGPSNIPLFNAWIQAGRRATGSSEVRNFDQALKTFLNEYAKVMQGSTGAGGTTDTARREAEELIQTSDNWDTVKSSIELLKQEMKNRTDALDEEVQARRAILRGREPAATTPPPRPRIPEAGATAGRGTAGSKSGEDLVNKWLNR